MKEDQVMVQVNQVIWDELKTQIERTLRNVAEGDMPRAGIEIGRAEVLMRRCEKHLVDHSDKDILK